FLQMPALQKLRALICILRRHYHMVYLRPSDPVVQILPFQNGIDRPANMEREHVVLRPKEQNKLRGRRAPADLRRESFLLVSCGVPRLDPTQVEPPTEHIRDCHEADCA